MNEEILLNKEAKDNPNVIDSFLLATIDLIKPKNIEVLINKLEKYNIDIDVNKYIINNTWNYYHNKF